MAVHRKPVFISDPIFFLSPLTFIWIFIAMFVNRENYPTIQGLPQ